MVYLFSLSCILFHGQVEEAEGRNGFKSGHQDWGYVTVRPSAHMFWWLYYVDSPNKSVDYNVFDKPLIIWLQGGPGGSSTGKGNFEEIGPFDIEGQRRNHTWVNDYNVLFIDNPVGTGFSYVDNNSTYASNNHQIAKDLIKCMRKFLAKIPEFKKVPTYIVGQSYGGKMAAEFALLWYQHQQNGTIISNLKGVAFGDSWISPITSVLSWAPFLLNTGMVDTEGYEKIQDAALDVKRAVKKRNWVEATRLWELTEQIIDNITGRIGFDNILERINATSTNSPSQISLENLMNNKVNKALVLNVTWGSQSEKVFENLVGDFMKPVTKIVTKLLDKSDLKVVVYTGQLDLIVPTVGTLSWVENLEWQYIKNWKESERIPIIVNDIIEGYVKGFKNFKMYWMNRAGHSVPLENPVATNKMMKDFTSGVHEVTGRKGFKSGHQDWGYVTVRPLAHMFWWLHFVNPPNKSADFNVFERPLIIWLQGGPGISSTYTGNFEQIGPFDIEGQPRIHTWINDYNVLFIDNPVGTGFSYVDDNSTYASNIHQIAKDLIKCMHEFLAKIPEFKKVQTYIVGQSYGGKMAAEFALLWYQHQQNGTIISNLKGVAFGNSWISPIDTILSWAPFLFNTGMVDTIGFEKVQYAAQITKKAVEQKDWIMANKLFKETCMTIIDVTENNYFYNILKRINIHGFQYYQQHMDQSNFMKNEVQQALSLNVTWGLQMQEVYDALGGDIMKPVTNIITKLLNESDLKLFVYTGQLDLICATPGTLSWMENLQWRYINDWKKAKRFALVVNNIIEGYVKEYKNLKMYWINRAGHYAASDNPYAINKMLKDLTTIQNNK
ncbi:hypothetical protein PV326_004422 [Microctonus aethiopoides]|nr:hypothetical protein PV326_004422 [Microctonus aethiopoides]